MEESWSQGETENFFLFIDLGHQTLAAFGTFDRLQSIYEAHIPQGLNRQRQKEQHEQMEVFSLHHSYFFAFAVRWVSGIPTHDNTAG